MRIGVFGGSFDPVHVGHAVMATYMSQTGLIDRLWLMVSPLNPLKEGRKITDSSHRVAMTRLVANEIDNVECSDFELGLPLPSYTYRTLCALRERYPEDEFVAVIGSDNWELFDKWKDHDKIISEFGVIVYPRPGYPRPAALPANVEWVDNPPEVMISSTFVRGEIEKGKNIRHYVTDGVLKYIKENNLYSCRSSVLMKNSEE